MLVSALSQPLALCVGDERDQRFLCARLMQKLGYHALTASSVWAALEMLDAHPNVSLIILDIHMPVQSGFDGIKLFKKNEATRHIPIIIVSNSSDPKDAQKALALGAAEYVGPPIQDDAIQAAVRRVTAGSA